MERGSSEDNVVPLFSAQTTDSQEGVPPLDLLIAPIMTRARFLEPICVQGGYHIIPIHRLSSVY